MSRIFKRIFSFFTCFSIAVFSLCYIPNSTHPVYGATYCTDYCGCNIEAQNYSKWSSTVKTYISQYSSTRYMTVYAGNNKYSAFVEYYSTSTHQLVLSRKISLELPIFGGFYESADNYFLITGQNNSEQSATTEVYRITKYDKSWKRISSVGLYDCNTTAPFDAGSCRMTDNGTYLLIRTCHEMYNGHQANVTIQVDMDNMTITDSYTDVMNSSYGYVSHSFNQFIKLENNNIISVDHGDAYPRSIALIKYKTDVSSGTFTPGWSTQCSVVDVFPFYGNTGDNTTGGSVGGFEISDSSYLIAGNSVLQDSDFGSRKTRNVFLATVNKSTLEVDTHWFTDYPEQSVSTSTPQLVKISDTSFMLLWSHNNKVYYVMTDDTGAATTRIYNSPGNLSDCQPLVTSKKVIWVTRTGDDTTFYEIPISTPQMISKTTVSYGHDTSNVTVSDTTSTLVCSKCGKTITMTDVDSNFNVWWKNQKDSGYYWSTPPSNLVVGDTLEVWVSFDSDATKNQEYIIESSNPDILSISGINNSFCYFLAKKSGSCSITITSRWNPSKYVRKTVQVSANTVSVTDEDLTINGFQFNPSNGGVRTIYTVADTINDLPVIETGLIYGLSPYVTSINELTVFSSSDYVYSYNATTAGLYSSSLGSEGTNSYVMTLTQKLSSVPLSALTAKYYVRVYAELSDGTYLYGNVYSYTLYNLADRLYQTQSMSSASHHNYLYNYILSVINNDYKAIPYNGTYGIIAMK